MDSSSVALHLFFCYFPQHFLFLFGVQGFVRATVQPRGSLRSLSRTTCSNTALFEFLFFFLFFSLVTFVTLVIFTRPATYMDTHKSYFYLFIWVCFINASVLFILSAVKTNDRIPVHLRTEFGLTKQISEADGLLFCYTYIVYFKALI